MPVKHWSRAGLMLTDWCSARCASCYLKCGPDRHEEMGVEPALRIWRELIEASPHGCRIHLSGGEPFGNWQQLLDLCLRARSDGLGPLEKIETNAFWAVDEAVVRDRIRALDAAGMQRLTISADPYHQEFVPIARCRIAARVAQEVLGPQRVQVRWRDWLAEGFDTGQLAQEARLLLFARYAAEGRDRFSGRAAEQLAWRLPCKPVGDYADKSCRDMLLRSRHVHVDPGGRIMPGTCAGIVLATAGQASIGAIWSGLEARIADEPILAALAARGPAGLLTLAESAGFVPRGGYAGKCHLCWDVRRHLAGRGLDGGALGPAWLYGSEPPGEPSVQ